MSDVELMRLKAKAKLKLKQQKPEKEKRDFAPSVGEMEAAKSQVEPTMGEALSTGFVEGVPFMKDAVSAYDAIASGIEEDNMSFDAMYGNYKENLDEANADINRVQNAAPVASTIGEIGGTMATLGAAGVAGAGAMAGSVGVGAAQGLSISENRGVDDALIGGAMGYAGEIGGRYVMKGLKKGGKYLMDAADDMGAGAIKRMLGMGNASTKRGLYKHLKSTNQKESEFIADVVTTKLDDGTQVIDFGETPERMLDKVQLKKREVGTRLGDAYKAVDQEFDVKIDLEEMKGSLSDEVLPQFKNSDDPGMQEIGMELEDYISKLGRKVTSGKTEITDKGPQSFQEFTYDTEWNLSRVHRLQKDINRRIQNIYKKNGLDLSAAKEQERRVAKALGNSMDDVLEAVSTPDSSVLDAVKQTRKQFGNMATVEETLEKEIFRAKDDPISMVKDALGFKSLLISGAATSAVGPAGMLVGPVAQRIMNSPKTPLYLAEGLKKLGTVTASAPTGAVASKLTTASIMNDGKFRDVLYGTIAEVNLAQQPVERTTESIMARQTDIRHLLKANHPSMVKDFDALIEDGNTVGLAAFIDTASKLPGADKVLAPGIGIDGRVYTQEDKAQLEIQLKQSDVPAAQRIEMLNVLRTTGQIPNMENIIRPEPRVHIPRTKKIQDY